MIRHPFRSATVPFESSRSLRLVVALVALAALSGGCIFSPKTGKGGGGGITQVPQNTTPHGAILLLAHAWATKDSSLADTVYAAGYQGTSIDYTDPTPTTLSFTKSDEVHALGQIQKAPEVSSVNMIFNSENSWRDLTYVGDPPDWITIEIDKPTITVNTTTDQLIANNGFFQFKVKPDTTSNGTRLWRIIRWTETR